jgi:hypothetical protein
MILYKPIFLIIFIAIVTLICGCEFEDPYVPDTTGSSKLTGQIVTEPETNLSGIEILLRGQDSFAATTDTDGKFSFQDIPPGVYTLQIQKKPYIQESLSVMLRKATDENLGIINVNLKGAIVGSIPRDKISIVHGEVEIVVYIDGVPLVPQQDDEGQFTIDLSSTKSDISIEAATRITVYIDNVTYSATVQDKGLFIVEFVPPGIYNDIRIKLNSSDSAFPIISGNPILVKSGQTRFIASAPDM